MTVTCLLCAFRLATVLRIDVKSKTAEPTMKNIFVFTLMLLTVFLGECFNAVCLMCTIKLHFPFLSIFEINFFLKTI